MKKFLNILTPVLLVSAGLLWILGALFDMSSVTANVEIGVGLLFILAGLQDTHLKQYREYDELRDSLTTVQTATLRLQVDDLRTEVENMKKRTSLLG